MRKIAVNGYLEPVGQMDLNVRSVVEKDTGRFLRAICINAVLVVIKYLLRQELFFIKPEFP